MYCTRTTSTFKFDILHFTFQKSVNYFYSKFKHAVNFQEYVLGWLVEILDK